MHSRQSRSANQTGSRRKNCNFCKFWDDFIDALTKFAMLG